MAAAPVIMAAGSMAYQIQQASAASRAQNATNKSIQESALSQYDELSSSETEALESTALEGLEAQKAKMKAEGNVLNIAGASGTAGGSIDQMLSDINQTSGTNLRNISRNRTTALTNIASQAESIRYGSQKQHRSFSAPVVSSAIDLGAEAIKFTNS